MRDRAPPRGGVGGEHFLELVHHHDVSGGQGLASSRLFQRGAGVQAGRGDDDPAAPSQQCRREPSAQQ